MKDDELEDLIRLLESRIPDADFRSQALMALVERRDTWADYTLQQWVNFCLSKAWKVKLNHHQRVTRWGGQAKHVKNQTLPAMDWKVDTLSPDKVYDLLEFLV